MREYLKALLDPFDLDPDPAKWRCKSQSNTPCTALVLDLARTVGREEAWPTHICPHIAAGARIRWALRSLPWPPPDDGLFGELIWWLGSADDDHGLAIGREATRRVLVGEEPEAGEARARKRTSPENLRVLLGLALFPGRERLYLPVVATLGDTTVEVFFLLDEAGDYGDIRYRITGTASGPVQELLGDARKWWRQFSQLNLAPLGRRRKLENLTYDDVVSVWNKIRPDYETDPTDAEFREVLEFECGLVMSKSTFARVKRRWRDAGMPWPPMGKSLLTGSSPGA